MHSHRAVCRVKNRCSPPRITEEARSCAEEVTEWREVRRLLRTSTSSRIRAASARYQIDVHVLILSSFRENIFPARRQARTAILSADSMLSHTAIVGRVGVRLCYTMPPVLDSPR